MPKSEFDSPLTVKAGKVSVSGAVGPEAEARGAQAPEIVHVHWVITQGDIVAHGRTDADGSTFTDEEASAQGWSDGPAHVAGVTVVVRRRPGGLETFKWEQDVELHRAP
jgi:hypothetical protein